MSKKIVVTGGSRAAASYVVEELSDFGGTWLENLRGNAMMKVLSTGKIA